MLYNLSHFSREEPKGIEYRGKLFPAYNKPIDSWLPNKKKAVLAKDGDKVKLIHFGDKNMDDFTQHKDKKRQANYLSRSAGIRDKSGKLTKDNKLSANYWARKILW